MGEGCWLLRIFRHELFPFVDFGDQRGDVGGKERSVAGENRACLPESPGSLRPELPIPFPGELSLTSELGLGGTKGTQDIPGEQHQTSGEGSPEAVPVSERLT